MVLAWYSGMQSGAMNKLFVGAAWQSLICYSLKCLERLGKNLLTFIEHNFNNN